jgi:endonuclease YncB( thermonuclease family)
MFSRARNCVRHLCCLCFLSCQKTRVVTNPASQPVPNEFDQLLGEFSHLRNASWVNCDPYVPNISHGKVIKVYDGDTITIASKLKNSTDDKIYRFSVRLLGIDSAEIKAKTVFEKNLAITARDALREKIMDRIVELRNITIEKYGRLLADVYCDGVHINEWLLQNGFAVPYDGGKKSVFVIPANPVSRDPSFG